MRFPEEMKKDLLKAIATEVMLSEDESVDSDRKPCFKVKSLSFRTRNIINHEVITQGITYLFSASKTFFTYLRKPRSVISLV